MSFPKGPRLALENALESLLPWHAVEPPQRKGLMLFLGDGLFVAVVFNFVFTYLPLYFLAMGATGVQVALLSSLNGAAGIAGCALSGRVVERLGSAKRTTYFFGRLWESGSLLLLAAVPFLAGGMPAIPILLALQPLRQFGGQIAMPSWAAFVGVLVPLPIRARYMALRNIGKMMLIAVTLPLSGAAIVALGGYPTGYQIMFVVMAVIGIAGSNLFRRIPESGLVEDRREPGTAPERTRWWRGAFGTFLAGLLGWIFFNAIAAPFYIVRMSQDLGLGATTIGLLSSFSSIIQTIGFVVLGRVIDRRGSRGAMLISLFALSLVPAAWLLVQNWYHILPIYLVSAFANAGYNLASLNLLLELSPSEGRAGYTSAYYSLVAIASTVAPLAGGWLFSQWAFTGTAVVSSVGALVAVTLFAITLRSRAGAKAPVQLA